MATYDSRRAGGTTRIVANAADSATDGDGSRPVSLPGPAVDRVMPGTGEDDVVTRPLPGRPLMMLLPAPPRFTRSLLHWLVGTSGAALDRTLQKTIVRRAIPVVVARPNRSTALPISGHRVARPRVRGGVRDRVLRLPTALPSRSADVPILMYHRVDVITSTLPAITRALTVSPPTVAAQMQWLHDHGFHAITRLQLFDALEHRAPLPPKPMITFDDGYRGVLWHAAPVLARLRMPATAYVITGRISGPDPSFLTWPELRRLERLGVVGSRRALEDHLDRPVQWFAYPAGAETPHAARLVGEAGYVLAVTTQPGVAQKADQPFALHRYEIQDTTGVPALPACLEAELAALRSDGSG